MFCNFFETLLYNLGNIVGGKWFDSIYTKKGCVPEYYFGDIMWFIRNSGCIQQIFLQFFIIVDDNIGDVTNLSQNKKGTQKYKQDVILFSGATRLCRLKS